MELHEVSIVEIPHRHAKAVVLLNIFLPGSGSILAGIKAGGDAVFNNVIVGLLQFVMTPFFLLGWFWSIYLAYLILNKSKDK